MANLAFNSVIQDRLQDAASGGGRSAGSLRSTLGLMELSSALMAKAQILARLGQVAQAKELIESLVDAEAGYQHNEIYAEAADAMDYVCLRTSRHWQYSTALGTTRHCARGPMDGCSL